ncbi:GNAT family N-acetyltransferase [Streptomyces novaecaesareae]|uniref:GNAT family N-acetyltransferase n=1 Tax=Streptomyces novaecaesareae TaxID=68244 RepID=UPI00068977D5|nr:GNAT family N-acetyltransferase [Streptomyces novaecaesareae]
MSTSDPFTSAPADRRVFRPTVLDLGDVRLRPWGRALDITGGVVPALVAAAADPEIAHWNPLNTADPAAAEAYLDRCDARWADGSSAAFAITDAADGTLLGNAYLQWNNRADGVVMVGYWLLAAARGRGLATRATTAVTRWAVDTADARRIELYHFVDNDRSCRVAVRAGFPYEGTLRASYRRAGGDYTDEHLHARLATDPFTDHPGPA